MRRVTVFLALAALAGCRPDYSPNVYSGTAVQQAAKVEQGIVVGVRRVGVAAQGAAGAVTGAAAGGVIGSQVPAGSGVGSALGALGGSLLGGLIGTTVERTAGDTVAFEYIVRKVSGELVSVTQTDTPPLALGTAVLVIAGSQARIVPDYTVPTNPVPPDLVPPKPSAAPVTLNPGAPAAPAKPTDPRLLDPSDS